MYVYIFYCDILLTEISTVRAHQRAVKWLKNYSKRTKCGVSYIEYNLRGEQSELRSYVRCAGVRRAESGPQTTLNCTRDTSAARYGATDGATAHGEFNGATTFGRSLTTRAYTSFIQNTYMYMYVYYVHTYSTYMYVHVWCTYERTPHTRDNNIIVHAYGIRIRTFLHS